MNSEALRDPLSAVRLRRRFPRKADGGELMAARLVMRGCSPAILLALVFAAACSPEPPPATTAPPPSTTPPRQVPIGQLPDVDTTALLQHTKVLSSDEYEGRAPGTKGEDLTVHYLE